MIKASRILIALAVALAMVLAFTGMALATTTGIPHGGYAANSDVCLQCHDVHEAAADYVLLRYPTVTDMCGSCHYIYLQNPGTMPSYDGTAADSVGNVTGLHMGGNGPGARSGGAGAFGNAGFGETYNPGYGTSSTPYNPFAASLGGVSGTEEVALYGTGVGNQVQSIGSEWSAYEVTQAEAVTAPGHKLQQGVGLFDFADGTQDTSADYIPGGSQRLTAVKLDGSAATYGTQTVQNFTGTGEGLYCADCHAPHYNWGNVLTITGGDTSSTRVAGKILSSKPNHQATTVNGGSITTWTAEGYLWCGACHDKRRSGQTTGPAAGLHNHPDWVCVNGCHGAYGGASPDASTTAKGSTGDFPHTGQVQNILVDQPDQFCINCHRSGYLP
jgi:predicted CXXCH cytochrome family protein